MALTTLNAHLRREGAPQATFGGGHGVPVGYVALRRPELCTLGLHRHFLSEVTMTSQGVESIVIGPDSPCQDRGERIVYSPQTRDVHGRLAMNMKSRRPVRVLRLTSTNVPLASRTATVLVKRDAYRYDGLYAVATEDAVGAGSAAIATEPERSDVNGDEGMQTDSAPADAAEEPRLLLFRLPDQPPLPLGTGVHAAVGAQGPPPAAPLTFFAEVVETQPACDVLPPLAEGWVASKGRGDAADGIEAATADGDAGLGSGELTVGAAYGRLYAARAALLEKLTPQDAYRLLKRSAAKQAQLRSAVDLLQHHYEASPPP